MVYQPDYVYTGELGENDPKADPPPRIKVALKPHQLTALHRALVAEREGKFYLRSNPELEPALVQTNVGIIGDMVGYGKTLIALGLIASNPVQTIPEVYMDRRFYQTAYSHFMSSVASPLRNRHECVPSTLLIVPHGPVFEQWKYTLETQTELSYLAIASRKDIEKNFPSPNLTLAAIYEAMSKWDVVLIKTTMVRNMYDHFTPFVWTHGDREDNPMHFWYRIIVDEAHDALDRIPWMRYRFIWLISATFHLLGTREYSSQYLGHSVYWVRHEKKTCLVRNLDAYVRQSFQVPDYVEHTHICREPYGLRRIRHILSEDIARMIDANNYTGAMRMLGVREHDPKSILEHISSDVERDLKNKRLELAYIEGLDIETDEKDRRKKGVESDILRLEDRRKNIQEQFQTIEDDSCAVCYETFKEMQNISPMVLPCNHVFCQPCIYRWYMIDQRRTCPCCREQFLWDTVVSIKIHENADADQVQAAPSRAQPKTKEEQLIYLIQNKPTGKFLIFASFDHSFDGVIRALVGANISFEELKGTTSTMMKTLERFKEGELQCILLHTYNTGSGIDISCATDVILMHSMGRIRQQAIGRAQRVGRTSVLTVHNLLHEEESRARE